jgi:2-polyprenyl-3-methyl-5-hydroxy-6-metoxy-1,4-benzoquinol methylase
MEEAEKIYPSNYYTLEGRHTGKGGSRLISYMKKLVVGRRLSFIRKELSPSARILEVGCGDGALLVELRNHYPEAELTGIDILISDETMKSCEASRIKLIQDSIEEVVLPAESFDLVVMNQVIEHLWKPDLAIRKILDALRPGALLSIETPNVSSYDRRLFPDGIWGGYYFPRHLNLFSFESLRRYLERHGFVVEKQRSLLGVIIWAFSFKALFCRVPEKSQSAAARVFSDKNPLCLGVFTIVDSIAKLIGLTTSNQKMIARKSLVVARR